MDPVSSRIISSCAIPDPEIREEFLCTASGPGGQNVNRTANTVRLIFHAAGSSLLDEESRGRLYKAHVPDPEGNLVILCRESRSLQWNRTRAREILAEWIASALKKPRRRKKTKPTPASRERRLKAKTLRSRTKSLRGKVRAD